MMFFKRLFSRREKPAAEHPRGVATGQTQAEQDATRKAMEAEMVEDRGRRGATDSRPDGEQPPKHNSA